MRGAVIYARYSSERQTEQSIEGQLRVCKKYAKDNNLTILNTYIDRAMTGTNDHRPSFQQMLHDCEKRVPWDIVLVYAIDRFGRNSIEIAVNKQKLKKNNKMLISATQRTSENIDGSKNLDGILLENMYIGLAEYYSAELSQKVRRGFLESHKKGQFTGGNIIYGYSLKDKKLSIVPEEAKVIQGIFNLYKKGYIARKIADFLNDKGLLFRNKPFDDKIVLKILHQRKYTGVCTYSGVEYDNIFPQIIPKELFEPLQLRLRANQKGSSSIKNPSIVKGLLFCGYCKNTMHIESGTSKTGKIFYYYKCSGKKMYHNGCKKQTVRKNDLDNLVVQITQSLFQNPENLEIIANEVIRQQNSGENENNILELLTAQQNEIQKSLNNILKAIEMGIVNDMTKQRMEELQERLAAVNEKIMDEQNNKDVKITKEEILKFLHKSICYKNDIMIQALIHHIYLFDDKIEIYYKYTSKSSPQDDGDCSDFLDNNFKIKIPIFLYAPISILKNNKYALKYPKLSALCNKKTRQTPSKWCPTGYHLAKTYFFLRGFTVIIHLFH